MARLPGPTASARATATARPAARPAGSAPDDRGLAIVVSALRGGRVIADAARVRPTHVLSLVDPEEGPIDLGPAAAPRVHVVVRFRDALTPETFDLDTSGVRAILDTLRACVDESRLRPVRLLMHCRQGQSRSPAAAYVGWALHDGPGLEADAFARARAAAGAGFWPNRLLVETLDSALGRRGALLPPLDAFRAKLSPPSAARIDGPPLE